MAELSEPTKNLIEKYKFWQQSLQPKQNVSTIHVDEVASRVAAFYEQIRTIVDWKEEHLMRRAAIIRKLERRFIDLELSDFSPAEEIAEPLVLELIRGGHFPNDTIEESKIADVKKIIDKYIFILKNNPENKKGKAGLQFYNWLIGVAACEIEETLAPPIKEMALIDYMFESMKEKIKVSEALFEKGILKKEEKDIQIYIAIQQALFKLDKPILSYNLIKYKYPQWSRLARAPDFIRDSQQSRGSMDSASGNNLNEDLLFKIAQNIYKIWKKIEKDLSHPLTKKFYVICEKYDTPYLLLGDILLKDNPQDTGRKIQEPAVLEGLIRDAYNKRLSTLKTRLWRTAIYSTLSIFLTKILSLVILEIFLAKIITGHFNFITLTADVLVPTGLMFILVITIKPPSRKNLNLVIMETMKIVYQKGKGDVYEIKIIQKKRGIVTRFIISLFYLLGACVSFGAIFWVFNFFKFPITSIIINFIFIALILFAGMAIRKRAQELTMEENPEGFFSFLSDILFLPLAGMGRWLSNKWKKYNVIAVFFNALIDLPFLTFVEFLEKWRYYIKEKKEEIH